MPKKIGLYANTDRDAGLSDSPSNRDSAGSRAVPLADKTAAGGMGFRE